MRTLLNKGSKTFIEFPKNHLAKLNNFKNIGVTILLHNDPHLSAGYTYEEEWFEAWFVFLWVGIYFKMNFWQGNRG